MKYEHIVLGKKGSVASLVLNRPEKMNSLSSQMHEEIMAALSEVDMDEKMRVLILTGAGDRAFCSGADLAEAGLPWLDGQIAETSRRQFTERVGAFVSLFREIRVPTIAAVNGVAVGVGLSMLLACDIRISSDEATFGAPWVWRGLSPDGAATYLLPQIVGIGNALRLLYTGEIIDAEEALRIGLVSLTVPGNELMKVTKKLAERLADAPPIAIEFTKHGVYRGIESNIRIALDYENYALAVCRRTEDAKEGFRSFLKKRKPRFKGC